MTSRRPRNLADYARAARRRKLILFAPSVVFALATALKEIPGLFESSAGMRVADANARSSELSVRLNEFRKQLTAGNTVGRVYFPLLGDVSVVGKTLARLQEYLSNSVAEFIEEPRVTLALLEAQSAKIGVLGDVKIQGLMVMTRPLRVLDALTLAGGILDIGSSSASILRQYEDGRVQVPTADVKSILKGKANPEKSLSAVGGCRHRARQPVQDYDQDIEPGLG